MVARSNHNFLYKDMNMEDKDYKGYYYKEYYVEEKHYRDELEQIDYFKAAKLFTDGSSDDFFTYSLEELYKIIESRTDNDIILNHYELLTMLKHRSFVRSLL
jgi:hypothetical protein